MAPATPTIEPNAATAGATWRWKRSLGDTPSPAWVLTYYFVNSNANFSFAAAQDGSDHLVDLNIAATEEFPPGQYRLEAYVSDGTDRHKVAAQWFTVRPDPTKQEGGFDPRSHNQIVLDNIQAVLRKRSTKDQDAYSVEGRSLSRTPIAELIKMESRYKGIVGRERDAARVSAGGESRYIRHTRFKH